MTVHSFHIFDRRGKTLFTKTYSSAANQQQNKIMQQQQSSLMDKSSSVENTGGNSDNVNNLNQESITNVINPLDEQRKLVFGMLFSLNELMSNLAPKNVENSSLHYVKTGSCTVHYYETMNGLRLALYTSNDTPYQSVSMSSASMSTSLSSNKLSSLATTTSSSTIATSSTTSGGTTSAINTLLGGGSSSGGNDGIPGTKDALKYIYVELWVDSVIRSPAYRPGKPDTVAMTNFETRLDSYFSTLPWFR